jgi:hypothetical protein
MDKQLSNVFGTPNSSHHNFLEYLSEIKLGGEDALIKLFLLTLPSYLQDHFKSFYKDRCISSFIHLISRFIDLSHIVKRMKMSFKISWYPYTTKDSPFLLLMPLSSLSRSVGYARDVEVLMCSTVSTCPRVGARCYP